MDLYCRENITDAGLHAIAEKCHKLTSLNLIRCKNITNAGLQAIPENCPNLTTLNLSYTNITDAGLKEIAKLKQLTTLDLANSHITDAGIRAIPENCPKLTYLDLRYCEMITDEGLTQLRTALPHCNIKT